MAETLTPTSYENDPEKRRVMNESLQALMDENAILNKTLDYRIAQLRVENKYRCAIIYQAAPK